MTTAKLRKTAAGVVENRVGMVHFRVNTWQNGSYGRFSHLRFRLSAAPGRGLAAVVARWLGVACPAGAGGCAPLRPLMALRAAWFLWQFAPRGTGAVARGASGWHTGGCGRLPFGIAKQAVLHGETGRSGRPRGTFGSAIRRKWLRGRGVVNVFHSPRRIAPTPVRHEAEYGQSACRRAF